MNPNAIVLAEVAAFNIRLHMDMNKKHSDFEVLFILESPLNFRNQIKKGDL
jgi:hypothetical protein